MSPTPEDPTALMEHARSELAHCEALVRAGRWDRLGVQTEAYRQALDRLVRACQSAPEAERARWREELVQLSRRQRRVMALVERAMQDALEGRHAIGQALALLAAQRRFVAMLPTAPSAPAYACAG